MEQSDDDAHRTRMMNLRAKHDAEERAREDATKRKQADEARPMRLHPVHAIVLVLLLVSFGLAVAAAATNRWYVLKETSASTNLTSTLEIGLFRQCNKSASVSQCTGVDVGARVFSRRNGTNVDTICERSADHVGAAFLIVRSCIVVSAICSIAALICVAIAGSLQPIAFSIVSIVLISIGFIAFGAAGGYWIWFQEHRLYCDRKYCALFALLQPESTCEQGFGYSAGLATLGFGLMLFALIIDVVAFCFILRAVQKADDLSTKNEPMKHDVTYDEQEAAPKKKKMKRVKKIKNKTATTGETKENEAQPPATAPPPTAPPVDAEDDDFEDLLVVAAKTPPLTKKKTQRKTTKTDRESEEEPSSPYTPVRSTRRDRTGSPPPPPDDGIEWTYVAEDKLYWSKAEKLYLDPYSRHAYDPAVGLWYDPGKREWYDPATDQR